MRVKSLGSILLEERKPEVSEAFLMGRGLDSSPRGGLVDEDIALIYGFPDGTDFLMTMCYRLMKILRVALDQLVLGSGGSWLLD